MRFQQDTIAAPATAQGESGIAIIRVSGERAEETISHFFSVKPPYRDHQLMYGHLQMPDCSDECMAVMMYAPKTYTRENVAEFQFHGGAWVSKKLMSALNRFGIRTADPGEFTFRAFINGRIDLSRAEAVMGIIRADSDAAGRSALRLLSGGVCGFIRPILDNLTGILSGIEASIDYPEEIDEEDACASMRERIKAVCVELSEACDERSARLLSDGLNVVLCGKTNVGKSSLLNAITGEECAIVTDIPGTTRDIVSASIQLNGVKVTIRDTAGLRDSSETIERIGIERAKSAVSSADLAILVLDAQDSDCGEEAGIWEIIRDMPHILVCNKSDLACAQRVFHREQTIAVSAKTGEGIDDLKHAIALHTQHAHEGQLCYERHIGLARKAVFCLQAFLDALDAGVPLDTAAAHLREAADNLSDITGDRMDEMLLDDIFSKFCVGK